MCYNYDRLLVGVSKICWNIFAVSLSDISFLREKHWKLLIRHSWEWCRKIDNWGAPIHVSLFCINKFFWLFSRHENHQYRIWAFLIIHLPTPLNLGNMQIEHDNTFLGGFHVVPPTPVFRRAWNTLWIRWYNVYGKQKVFVKLVIINVIDTVSVVEEFVWKTLCFHKYKTV